MLGLCDGVDICFRRPKRIFDALGLLGVQRLHEIESVNPMPFQ